MVSLMVALSQSQRGCSQRRLRTARRRDEPVALVGRPDRLAPVGPVALRHSGSRFQAKAEVGAVAPPRSVDPGTLSVGRGMFVRLPVRVVIVRATKRLRQRPDAEQGVKHQETKSDRRRRNLGPAGNK
jgi:hypothetical protein